MGLRNKAETSKETLNQALSGLNINQNDPDFGGTDESYIDFLKKKGTVTLEDIFKRSESGTTPEKSNYNFILPHKALSETLPADSELLLQNRIESMLNLIELCKEMGTIDSEEELWESIILNILGQIGAKEAAIFIKEHQRLTLKAVKGFIIPEEFLLSRRSGIERVLKKDNALHYAKDLLSQIYGDENLLLSSLSAEIVIPVLRYQDIVGFVILGKSVSGSDYITDDLLYLKLLGELLGSFYESIQRIAYIDNQKKNWNEREKHYRSYLAFQNNLQNSIDPDMAEKLLSNYLNNIFPNHNYIFFIKENEEFQLIIQKGFQGKSIAGFKSLKPYYSWINELSTANTWTEVHKLKNMEEFTSSISMEDQSIINKIHLLPLFFHGNLRGIFMLFKIDNIIDIESLRHAEMALINYFWLWLTEKYIDRDETGMEKSQTDPLYMLRKKLTEKEKLCETQNEPFSVYMIWISNSQRIISLYNEKKYAKIKKEIKKIIQKNLESIHLISEINNDYFITIINKQSKADLWAKDKIILKAISESMQDYDLKPTLRNRIYCRPEDNKKNVEQLLRFW